MRVGLLADTHDCLDRVVVAAALFRREEITMLLHCGDVCGPAVVEALAAFDVHFAQGNMDRLPTLGLAVEALHGPGRLARYHALTLNGTQVAVLHGHDDDLLRALVRSGEYAYLVHGHTHRRADRKIGATRVINPGALGGRRPETRSVGVLDLENGQVRFIDVERS